MCDSNQNSREESPSDAARVFGGVEVYNFPAVMAEQLPMNSGRSPANVGYLHIPNQPA
jgi:hypothetical protein